MAMGQVNINGTVKDHKGKPISGVSVSLKDTYDGSTSDSLGHYSFETTEKGSFLLEASCLGYGSYMVNLQIDNKDLSNNIVLKKLITDLEAVVISAGTFEASDKKKGTVLTSLDIVTTAGADGDVTGALKTLPGTQQVGETGGLFVRGGTATESNIYMDGALVNNFFYSSTPGIASRGRFNPFLFKGTVFSTGGYSAQYGQALSSALILESIDLPEQSAANLSISPIILGGGYQNLAKDKKSSWGVNYNYLNLAAYFNLVKQTPDYFKVPAFHNGDANFRFKTKKGIVKYYTTFANSNLGLRRPDIDSAALKDAFGLKNINWYNNLSWKETLGNGWKMNLGLGYSTNTDDLLQELQNQQNQKVSLPSSVWAATKNFKLKSRQDLSQIKVVLEKRLFGSYLGCY